MQCNITDKIYCLVDLTFVDSNTVDTWRPVKE